MPDFSAEWETESGLATEYDLEVDEAFFATDLKYQDGDALLLHWKGRAFEPNGKFDTPLLIGAEGGNEAHVMLPCGAGWDSNDGGKTAEKPGKTMFNSRSVVGMIIDEMKRGEIPGADILLHRGGPRSAAIWVGVRMHLKSRELVYKGLTTTNRLMPVKVYGLVTAPWGGAVNVTPAATAPAPAPAAAPAAAPAPGAPVDLAAKRQALLDQARAQKERHAAQAAGTGNGKPEHLVTLEQLAITSPTHEAFLAPALQVDEILLDETLAAAVVDDGPNGFYATHHAAF